MSADFTPDKENVSSIGAFRFWCQKVLPVVYDDSLSYYELLCKVVAILNVVIENTNKLSEGYTSLYSAFETLQNYVNEYFGNLDLSGEVDRKIDQMVAEGFFDELVQRVAIPISQKGAANGVATLNSAGKLVQIPTLADLGAAPAGFGLGVSPNELSDTDFNNITKNGWYGFGNQNSYTNAPPIGYATLTVSSRANDTIVQEVTNGVGKTVRRVHVDGAWSAWEWINPPLVQGVEYRTTERYEGNAVYCKLFNAGTVAASSNMTVNIITEEEAAVSSVKRIVSVNIFTPNNNIYLGTNGDCTYTARGRNMGEIYVNNANTTYSYADLRVLVKYTKN